MQGWKNRSGNERRCANQQRSKYSTAKEKSNWLQDIGLRIKWRLSRFDSSAYNRLQFLLAVSVSQSIGAQLRTRKHSAREMTTAAARAATVGKGAV